ncbi:MAG TPA: hypothetical protein VG672_29345 [Bryobacteraceae bacterium]|jgi:hypothetical protein|nr:hypothetical protein [Bryobacteraceae bacterium]
MRSFSASRRSLLELGTLFAGSQILAPTRPAHAMVRPPHAVRDRFWLWGHYEGSHNAHWNLPGTSRITPVEAAFYLAIPNVILVRYEGKPAPPFEQYAVPFRALREVVWSVVGAGGTTADEEREAVLRLAGQNANFTGVMMDDFFTGKKEGNVAALSVDELKALQSRLKSGKKKLDLWVVLYTKQLDDPVGEHLKHCDVLTLWTWNASQIGQLSASFDKAQALSPGTRKVLGCYMWDYGDKKPMPISAMREQCERGLAWLKEGKIEGMIFLASCICDLNLETVEWTRQWIRKVGGDRLSR